LPDQAKPVDGQVELSLEPTPAQGDEVAEGEGESVEVEGAPPIDPWPYAPEVHVGDLERLIALRYPHPEWAIIYELANGTGAKMSRAIDVAAFNCWPSKLDVRVAFEVKRSRNDFIKELNHPDKRAWCERYFHECYFVTHSGLVKPSEVPEPWGLLEAPTSGTKLVRRAIAKHREPEDIPKHIWLAALRALSKSLHSERVRTYRFEGQDITHADLEHKVELTLETERERLEHWKGEARKQQLELQDARNKLTGPLRTLAGYVGEGLVRDIVDVTSEDVHQWVLSLKRKSVRDMMQGIQALRKVLDDTIKDAEAQGFEVPSDHGRRRW